MKLDQIRDLRFTINEELPLELRTCFKKLPLSKLFGRLPLDDKELEAMSKALWRFKLEMKADHGLEKESCISYELLTVYYLDEEIFNFYLEVEAYEADSVDELCGNAYVIRTVYVDPDHIFDYEMTTVEVGYVDMAYMNYRQKEELSFAQYLMTALEEFGEFITKYDLED